MLAVWLPHCAVFVSVQSQQESFFPEEAMPHGVVVMANVGNSRCCSGSRHRKIGNFIGKRERPNEVQAIVSLL